MSTSLKSTQHHFSPNGARHREKRPPHLPYKRRSRLGPYLGYPLVRQAHHRQNNTLCQARLPGYKEEVKAS